MGSTIVAEVLIGLVRRSDDSILRTAGWTPTLPAATPGRFELADLHRFAKVLPTTPGTDVSQPTTELAEGHYRDLSVELTAAGRAVTIPGS